MGTTILVVDDEPSIIELVADALTEEGYTVQTCADGRSAIASVQAAPPDLILLDINLPSLTGDAVLNELRACGYSELPVILMTAGINAEKLNGVEDTPVLRKPFTINTLYDAVSRLI